MVGPKLRSSSLLLCYELTHKRGIMSFKNDVMDVFRKSFADNKMGCDPTQVQLSNERGLSDTSMHDCILRSVVICMLDKPKDFLEREDLITSLNQMSEQSDSSRQIVNGVLRYLSARWSNPHMEKGCCYHDHSDGKACEQDGSN